MFKNTLYHIAARLDAYAIILISTFVMQTHSIPFWQIFIGETGIILSLALEAAMLWMWYHRRLKYIKFLAAAILIAGPWYQMTIPIFEKIGRIETLQKNIVLTLDEIEEAKSSISNYEETSKKRYGWASRIDRTKSSIASSREELKGLYSEQQKLGPAWRIYAVASMQIIILFILLKTQISAITNLREKGITEPKRNPKPAPKSEKKQSESKNNFEETIKAVAAALNDRLPEFKGSQKDLALHYKTFRPADISLVINHKNNIEFGKEKISAPALIRMAKALNVEIIKNQ